MTDVFSFQVKGIEGEDTTLEGHRGSVLLIVNVASKCGFTPQYAGLEKIHKKFRERGFAVLGFPCNQFGGQEPDDELAIKSFCTGNYDVSFPLFAKIAVNGGETHPLYRHLKSECPGLLGTEAIKWNFTKFLIARDGKVIRRYSPNTAPESIEPDIEAALSA